MNDSPPLYILADDLTGAADSAARWCARGGHAEVALAPNGILRGTGCTAFVSDSRHLSAADAAQRVKDTLASLNLPPHVRWYKKIDSTLRGNLGAELDAMLATLGRTHALICPSFPDQQRGLAHGQLVCSATVAAPTDLIARLAEQSQQVSILVPLETVRANPETLTAALVQAAANANYIVCDALTNADLMQIIQAGTRTLPDALLCGSAGMLGALATYQRYTQPSQTQVLPRCKRILVVVGSGSPTAHQQIETLADHFNQHLTRICVDLADPVAYVEETLNPTLLLLHQPPPPMGMALDNAQARQRAQTLATYVAHYQQAHSSDMLVVVGGDTAMAILQQLGVERLQIVCELMPGVPLARAVCADQRELLIVLKAGSFGDSQTLVKIVQMCKANNVHTTVVPTTYSKA